MTQLIYETAAWERDADGSGWLAECGAVALFVTEDPPRCYWTVAYEERRTITGVSEDAAHAKTDAIAAALKLLAESTSLLIKLRQSASAPCANCGGLARKDGRCVGCGEAVSS